MKAIKQKKPVVRRLICGAAAIVLGLALLITGLNLFVCLDSKGRMHSAEDRLNENEYDCIIVLGCGVWGKQPTPLLSDRLDAALTLYKNGAAPKLLMSGDHGQTDYDEVSVMRQYALDRGVPSEDIFLDHAGFSTYETMYRAWDIFGVKKAVVVTQKYHLYRALYDAKAFGIQADGVIATGHVFAAQTTWNVREALARVKDFVWCFFKPEPTFRGEKIDLGGNGEETV